MPVQRAERRPARRIALLAASESGNFQRLVENQFIDIAARSIREAFSADVLLRLPEQAFPGMLCVTVRAFELRQRHLGIRVVLEETIGQRALWSETVMGECAPGPVSQSVDHLSLCNRLVGALSFAFLDEAAEPEHYLDANYLAGLALRKMFSMEHNALEEADHLLTRAAEFNDRGVFHGWRAQLAAIQFVEQAGASREVLRERARAHSSYALSTEPLNSNVLSCVANARLILENNVVASEELARMSVESNRANPLGWWSLANSKLYGGDTGAAYDAAKMAQRLSTDSVFKFWTGFQVALIAAVNGRIDEAVAQAELASALAPNFRPPLRYLVALLARRGDLAGAAAAAARLKALEPAFTLERLADDDAYPVSMMRRAGLIDRNRLGTIEA